MHRTAFRPKPDATVLRLGHGADLSEWRARTEMKCDDGQGLHPGQTGGISAHPQIPFTIRLQTPRVIDRPFARRKTDHLLPLNAIQVVRAIAHRKPEGSRRIFCHVPNGIVRIRHAIHPSGADEGRLNLALLPAIHTVAPKPSAALLSAADYKIVVKRAIRFAPHFLPLARYRFESGRR